jgi:hypothetical protein
MPPLHRHMSNRRFPPPWSVEEQDACFVVVDRSGQKLAYIYFEEEPGRRSSAKLLTKDEARRIAVNMAGGSRCSGAACVRIHCGDTQKRCPGGG